MTTFFTPHVREHQVGVGHELVPLVPQLLVFALADDCAPLEARLQVERSTCNCDALIADRHAHRLTNLSLINVVIKVISEGSIL